MAKGLYELWIKPRHNAIQTFRRHGEYINQTDAQRWADRMDNLGFDYEIIAAKDRSLVATNV